MVLCDVIKAKLLLIFCGKFPWLKIFWLSCLYFSVLTNFQDICQDPLVTQKWIVNQTFTHANDKTWYKPDGIVWLCLHQCGILYPCWVWTVCLNGRVTHYTGFILKLTRSLHQLSFWARMMAEWSFWCWGKSALYFLATLMFGFLWWVYHTVL